MYGHQPDPENGQSLGLFIHETRATQVEIKLFGIPKSCFKGDPQLERETPLAHREMSEMAGLGVSRITWPCNHCEGEGHEAPALNEFWAWL